MMIFWHFNILCTMKTLRYQIMDHHFYRSVSYRIVFFLLFNTACVFSQHVNYWNALPKPTPNTLTRVHFIDSLRGWITGQNGVLMSSTDGGLTWAQRLNGLTGEVPDIYLRSNNDLWALEYRYPADDTSWFGTNIYHSTDGGTNWAVQKYDSTIFRTIYFQDSLTGFMGGSYGTIVKTTNGGQSWYRVSDSSLHKFPVYKIKFYSRSYGFAVGGQLEIAGIIWKTTNGGESWQSKIVSGDPIFNIHYFDSSHVFCGMGDIDQSGAGFMRTVDAGSSWNFENTTIWGEPMSFAFRTPDEGWVPMGIAGMCLKTTDEGITWEQIPVPQQISVFDISFPDSKTGYMVGHKGALYKFNSQVLSAVRRPTAENLYALMQNYPNPFNGQTTITFSLPYRSHVTIEVQDVLGRLVETIVDGDKTEGSYTIPWNFTNLPSGIYFYRITAGTISMTKKMLLVR